MARRANGVNANYLSRAVTYSTVTDFTVAGWWRPRSNPATGSRPVFSNGTGGTGGSGYSLAYQSAAGGNAQMVQNTVAWLGAGSVLALDALVHFAMARSASGNVRYYLGGILIEQVAMAGTVTPSGIISAFGNGGAGSAGTNDGELSELAIWKVGLTADEIGALARGVSPALVRRISLSNYWPLQGNVAPEPDLSAGAAGTPQPMTVNGTLAKADHGAVGPPVPPMEA